MGKQGGADCPHDPHDSASDLEAPLLVNGEAQAEVADDLPEQEAAARCGGQCSNSGAVCNLAVTAIGAGMLALPKAFSEVGIGLGIALFIAVCFLTYYSSSIIIKWGWELKKQTYGDVVLEAFGPKGAKLLQTSIIIHVLGVMIVYCIIIADMLVGSAPNWEGILPTMLHRHDGVWFLSRSFVVGVLIVALVLPMLISRDLTVVARYSRLSVFMMLILTGTIAGLAGIAVVQGKAAAVRILPSTATMGGGGLFDIFTTVFTVISVGCLAMTCQFNLMPVHHSLKNKELGNMLWVTQQSIALCALLYSTIGLSGYVLFGDATEGDVLKNLTINFVKRLVGRHVAVVLINGIVLCNTFNLLVNFVLKVWAVRDSVSQLVLDKPAAYLPPPSFYALTLLLVVLGYGISVLIPSVWFLVSLIGSTACMVFSYTFPGLLAIRLGTGASTARKAGAAGAVAMSAVIALLAVYNTLMGKSEM